jgi:hypothetical protein
MAIKENSIVRHLPSGEIYEVRKVMNELALCLPIDKPEITSPIPVKVVDLELLVEDDVDIFDLYEKG